MTEQVPHCRYCERLPFLIQTIDKTDATGIKYTFYYCEECLKTDASKRPTGWDWEHQRPIKGTGWTVRRYFPEVMDAREILYGGDS